MSDLGRSSAPDAGAVMKAKWYLLRTGNRDLWEVLGLVEDPVAAAGRAAKVLRDHSSTRAPKPVARPAYCPTCHNKVTNARPCRRTMACRKAAEEAS
jgi:hypothetical protein